ncbi:4'-phosphopantetheinyl transferase superfamily protein [Micrococcales bacterium 31B]|nr:4'-phosphopantetheinyl transferase superfamily protein [Micrococcales bacterium 31B]
MPESAASRSYVGVDTEPLARFNEPDLRLFTAAEVALGRSAATPAEFYAGRWCAKEAIVKAAWPLVRLSPREVEVLRDDSGRPVARLLVHPPVSLHIDVSITHDEARAVAFAIVMPA